MHNLTFDEIGINQKAEFYVCITNNNMEMFREITGDCNPLHCDSSYAKECGYKDVVSYGMLTASFVSTLAGCYLPGVRSLVQNINLDFVEPVYIGERLKVIGTVSHKSELVKTLKLRIQIVKDDGNLAVRGTMLVGVRDNG